MGESQGCKEGTLRERELAIQVETPVIWEWNSRGEAEPQRLEDHDSEIVIELQKMATALEIG